MNFNILSTGFFEKELTSLAKKYPSIKKDVASLCKQLEANPKSDTPLGNDCYKIRIAISSKGQRKSGGARVITHVQIKQEGFTCFPSSISQRPKTFPIKQLNAA